MFFPLMFHKALNGFLNVVYLPSNNWENTIKDRLNIYGIYSDGLHWNSIKLSQLDYGQSERYEQSDFNHLPIESNLLLIYPTKKNLPLKLGQLPDDKNWYSTTPAWRNSTGFCNQYAQVSYQAELEPFPSKASLLTFHPFIQYKNMKNNLLIVNATKEPTIKTHEVKVYNSITLQLIDVVTVKSNSTSEIPLDGYNFNPVDLPVFSCDTMAGIPFGLGISNDDLTLSLEHTHPPASLVIFGDRRRVQAKIKQNWFKKLESAN
jgi:hypothetical protein